MEQQKDYSRPIHKSLLQPDLIAGIPKNALYIILAVTFVAWALIGKWGLLIAVVTYFPVKIITAKDPHLLAIDIESILDPDYLES